jgi:hypothetical protein
VCDRNPCDSWATDCRGDTGDDLEWNTFVDEILHLFATPAEEERVTALEPDDRPSLAGVFDQSSVGVRLRCPLAACSFPDIFAALVRDQIDNVGPGEFIMQNDICRL